MEELEISFGAQPSEHDYRDIKHKDITLASIVPPSYVEDYSNIPISMQNRIGICTANLCDFVEHLFEKRGIKVRLSRRFLYTVTKQLIDKNTTEGSSLRSALKAAYNYGIAPESMVPTDTMVSHEEFIKEFNWPKAVWDEALKYRIGGYVSVAVDRDSIAQAIYEYGGIYAMLNVGKEWYSNPLGYYSWRAEDVLPLRKPVNVISGHAVVSFGYDNTQKSNLSLRNSWSNRWANLGTGNLYLEDYAPHFREAWAVTLSSLENTLPKKQDFKHVFTSTMMFGQTSEEIKKLQTFLKIEGYFNYPDITGYYGNATRQAVFDFQRDHVQLNWGDWFLAGTIAGPKTILAMNNIIASF